MRVILASQSPRRKELISKIFDNVEYMAQNVNEDLCETDPIKLVEGLALKKLNNLDKIQKDALIISADTIVYFNNKQYGKPKDVEDAIKILTELSNNKHEVYTGVCIAYKGERYLFYDLSKVKFKDLSIEDIKNYIKTSNPLDKAGAYGIQDNNVIESYEGSYSNIMGFPLEKINATLKSIGVI